MKIDFSESEKSLAHFVSHLDHVVFFLSLCELCEFNSYGEYFISGGKRPFHPFFLIADLVNISVTKCILHIDFVDKSNNSCKCSHTHTPKKKVGLVYFEQKFIFKVFEILIKHVLDY